MVKNHSPPEAPSSYSATRLGCEALHRLRNSFLKRASPWAVIQRSVFRATRRPCSAELASYTTPMPPEPTHRSTSYSPSRTAWPSAS